MKYEYLKGSEKDFENYNDDILTVYRINSGLMCHKTTKPAAQVILSAIGSHISIIAERRPITEPVFSVEWLPPVGSRIQYSCIKFDDNRPAIEFGKWYEGTVIAYYEGFVWTSDNGIRRLDNAIFRPIKAPEDAARDEAGLAIYHAINWNSEGELVSPSRMEDYKKAYDAIAAGRIPGVTKTPTVSELMRVTENATREDCEAIVKLLSGK